MEINIFTTTAHFLFLQILLVFVYLTTYLTIQFNQHILRQLRFSAKCNSLQHLSFLLCLHSLLTPIGYLLVLLP